MKLKLILFLLVSITILSCHKVNLIKEKPVTKTNISKKAIQKADTISQKIEGDFNGDGKNEKAWLDYPLFHNFVPKYIGDIPTKDESYIRFSNPQIPSIKIKMCIGGHPVNEGDLNGDGADEVGLLPEWWEGNWYCYQVYTFSKGKWKMAVNPIHVYYADYYKKGFDIIKKDPRKRGYAIISYSEVNETGDFVVKTKSVRVKR